MTRETIFKWAAIALFVAVNVMISLAMVIAPPGSSAATNSGLYKGTSLIFGLIVLWLSLRRRNYLLLAGFSMLQLFAFGRFVEALKQSL